MSCVFAWPGAQRRRPTAASSYKAAISRYIGSFYNPVRRRTSLNFISPDAYERQVA
jgi:hypothetical protein